MDELVSIDEQSRFTRCEEVIEHGLNTFVEVGNALLEIRDNRLYRQSYSTFEDYCKERWGMKRQRAYELMSAADVVNNLSEISDKFPSRESHTAPLTALEPEQQREAWQRVIETKQPEKITAKDVQEVVDEIKGVPHVSHNSGENEWYTPKYIIEAARMAMGSIDTDPASCEIANSNVKAECYFDINDNGLSQEWTGNVWLNPPYAQPLVYEFTSMAVNKYLSGEINQAIILVTNATETKHFQYMLEHCSAVCFPVGRIRYISKYGDQLNQGLQGQAILYFGNRIVEFTMAFGEIGKILYANPASLC